MSINSLMKRGLITLLMIILLPPLFIQVGMKLIEFGAWGGKLAGYPQLDMMVNDLLPSCIKFKESLLAL